MRPSHPLWNFQNKKKIKTQHFYKSTTINNWLTDMTNKMQLHTLTLLSTYDFIFSICANHFKSIHFLPISFSIISRDLPESQIPVLSTTQRSPLHRSDQKAFFNILWDIYPTRARPLCNSIDTTMENMKSEILYEKVQHP